MQYGMTLVLHVTLKKQKNRMTPSSTKGERGGLALFRHVVVAALSRAFSCELIILASSLLVDMVRD